MQIQELFSERSLGYGEEVVGVELDVVLPVGGEVFGGEDGADWADGNAGGATDAVFGIDEQLRGGVEFGFVLTWMNAIDRANVDAGSVFDSGAGFGDDVRHESSLLRGRIGALHAMRR
jgi:hypothetical protein